MYSVPQNQLNAAIKKYALSADAKELVAAAKRLYDEKDECRYTALLLMKMFEEADPDLCSLFGDCYYQGNGVEKNTAKAESFFRRAAQQGSMRADYDVAWLYYDQGNYKQAIDYFLRCKNNIEHFTSSQRSKIYHCLGYAYSNLADPDYRKAVEYYSEAAEKYENILSYRQLGVLCIQDEHNRDIAKALRYFDFAAQKGDLYSVHEMVYAFLYGIPDIVEKDLAKAEQYLSPHEDCSYRDILIDFGVLNKKRENWKKSAHYFQRAWDLGESAVCAGDLGYAYFRLHDYPNAERYLRYADERGDYAYSDFLGRIYADGKVGYRNKTLAIQCYGRAYSNNQLNNVYTYTEYIELLIEDGQYEKAYEVADSGEQQYNDIEFVYQKAKLVLQGKVRKISKDEAAEMMEDVVEYDGYEDQAHYELGRYYHANRRYMRAIKHLSASFESGDVEAAVILGRIYEKGDGSISADTTKAYEWYVKAANAGSSTGKAEMACFRSGLFGGYKRVRHI